MLVPFDDMPGSARIWIYQSNRTFSSEDIATIEQQASDFFNQWAAHGNPLKSAFQILHQKFLVVSVDEHYNQASGCSIDASVALVRQLESELGINFFDRTQVCFMADGQIFESQMTELKSLIAEGKVTQDTLTFNNLVQNVEELQTHWMVPAQDSWLKRYF